MFVIMPQNEQSGTIGEYLCCVFELLKNENLNKMTGLKKHRRVDCMDHCLFVSYYSFIVCKNLGLDYKSAARGGLLHDFYLYSKDDKNKPKMHRMRHPKIALEKACECFELSDKEKDIILRHMWPITPALPRYRESYVVDAMDKYCTWLEVTDSEKLETIDEIRSMICF